MSTKGSWQRPFDSDAWASNFERIFGKGQKPITVTVPAPLPVKDCWGVAEWSKASDTKSDGSARVKSPFPDVGSNPTAPAIIRADGDYTVYCADGLHFWAKQPDVRHAIKRSACTCPTYVDDATGTEVH